jgi:DNA-binding NtrC family response regulator
MEKKEPRASDPPMEKQKGDARQVSSTVILVVDDDKMQRDILKTILSDEGYEAHGASSAEEALEAAQTLKPDVVLTDLRLDRMDGMELMKQLRSQADAPEVLIMSAFGTPHIIEESARKGAFSFMQKPLEKNQVLFTIKQALEITARIKNQYL